MKNLLINGIKFTINTEMGQYDNYTKLSKGINIILGENGSGKSTLIDAIPYCLGLDRILGDTPGPSVFCSALNNFLEDGSRKQIKVFNSFVEMEIQNYKGQIMTVRRGIKTNNQKEHRIIRVFEGKKIEDDKKNSKADIYYIHDRGSYSDILGFHRKLVDFLDWSIHQALTTNNKFTKLYLECIFPFMFIEQQKGWGSIQSTIPFYYKIKNVIKNSIEYLLNLDIYNNEKLKNELELKIRKIEDNWKEIIFKIDAIAEKAGGFVENRTLNVLKKYNMIELPQIMFPVDGKIISIEDKLEYEQNELKKLINITLQPKKIQEIEKQLDTLNFDLYNEKKNLKELYIQYNDSQNNIKILNEKLRELQKDKKKYLDVKRIEEYSSLNISDVDLSVCPYCGAKINGILHNPDLNIMPLSLDENIKYIEQQIENCNFVLNNLNQNFKKIELYKKNQLQKVNQIRKTIRDKENDILEPNIILNVEFLRKKVEIENKIDQIIQSKEQYAVFFEDLSNLIDKNNKLKNELSTIPDDLYSKLDNEKIASLSELYKDNIKFFNFRSSAKPDVIISGDNYLPIYRGIQESNKTKDIIYRVNYSASDVIRSIWSYSISLAEVENIYKNTNHFGILVYDEPRQQNIDEQDIKKFYERLQRLNSENFQIIITTSDKKELLEQVIDLNKINFIEIRDRLFKEVL